jgi:hypothetical protein
VTDLDAGHPDTIHKLTSQKRIVDAFAAREQGQALPIASQY